MKKNIFMRRFEVLRAIVFAENGISTNEIIFMSDIEGDRVVVNYMIRQFIEWGYVESVKFGGKHLHYPTQLGLDSFSKDESEDF